MVEPHVLKLLFRLLEVDSLLFLSNICPHVAELFCLITSVHVVENSEFGTDKVRKVSQFDVAKIEREHVLVMPNHSTKPLVVAPASHTRDRVNTPYVEEKEEESAARSRQRFVMRRYLFGADCLKKCLHVVEMRHSDWELLGMIWVLVTLLHLSDVLLIEALTVFGFVFNFVPSYL